jgi:hypothetical protein
MQQYYGQARQLSLCRFFPHIGWTHWLRLSIVRLGHDISTTTVKLHSVVEPQSLGRITKCTPDAMKIAGVIAYQGVNVKFKLSLHVNARRNANYDDDDEGSDSDKEENAGVNYDNVVDDPTGGVWFSGRLSIGSILHTDVCIYRNLEFNTLDEHAYVTFTYEDERVRSGTTILWKRQLGTFCGWRQAGAQKQIKLSIGGKLYYPAVGKCLAVLLAPLRSREDMAENIINPPRV